MPWIVPAIGAVATLGKAAIESDAQRQKATNQGLGGGGYGSGGMDLGKMFYSDSSMNNGNWTVTTNGAVSKTTASTDRTTSPSTSASIPSYVGMGGSAGSGGLDMTTIMILIAGFMLMSKK